MTEHSTQVLMGGVVTSLSWWSGLRHPRTGTTGSWVEPGFGDNDPNKMTASRRVQADEYPAYVLHWYLCPQGKPGDLLRPASRSASGFCEITAFALDPSAHEILCEPCDMSTSPNSAVLLQSNPLDLHSQLVWGLLFPELDTRPQLGGLMWVSELSLL